MELLLGMLIWLGKWVPSVEGLTVDRLMNAIDALVFRGLERGHTLAAKAHPHKA